MSKFKIGDKVRIHRHVKSTEAEKHLGEVCTITEGPNGFGEGIFYSTSSPYNGGVYESELEPVSSTTKTNMIKITPMLKTMLDKKGRTLYKADFLNGDLELTEDGKSALNTLLFEANKDELVKLAEEKLKEEK